MDNSRLRWGLAPQFALLLALGGLNSLAHSDEKPAATSAAAQMQKSHDGRATWKNFPGFEARIRCRVEGAVAEGRITVSPKGDVVLTLPEDEQFAWVQRTLKSVISHRLSDGQAITNVEFADDQADHPRGRLIRSRDPNDKTLWRVQGDVLNDLHRVGKDSRFVISVTDVWRTAEGTHLPKSFDVVTWAIPSGEILSARQVHQDWRRVGGIDLPTRYLAITNRPGVERVAQQIEIFDHVVSKNAAE